MKIWTRVLFLVVAALSSLASIYCVLWVFSTGSLASGYCQDGFSLFAEAWRCRQVHIAMILAALFALLAVYTGWRATGEDRRAA